MMYAFISSARSWARFSSINHDRYLAKPLSVAILFASFSWAAAQTATAQTTPPPQQVNAATLIGDSVEQPDSPQYKGVTAAIEKFKARDTDAARTLLTEVRTTHRTLPPVEVLMAKLFALANQPPLMRTELELAVRRNPLDPEAYLLFAELAVIERRVTDAEALYDRAAELMPEFKDNPMRRQSFQKRLLNGQATVAESRLQWETSEKLLRSLLAMDKDNAAAQQRLGRAIFQQAGMDETKKYKETYDAFVGALTSDKNAVKPDVAMGQLFEQAAQENSGDTKKHKYYRDKAAEFYQRATATKDLNSHLSAANWALQTDQLPLAQTYAEAALKLDPTSVDAKLARAVIARFSGDLVTAEKHLSEAFTQSPGSFPISNQLALVLADTKDSVKRQRAKEIAEVNVRQYQKNPEAAATLGWVYYVVGEVNKAETVLNQLLNANALGPDSAFYVAKILNDRERLTDAKEILRLAVATPQPFANRKNAKALMADIETKIKAKDKDTDTSKGTAPVKSEPKDLKSKATK